MKKFLMGLVAAMTLCFAAPQTADAKMVRGIEVLNQDFFMRYTYDDKTGWFGIEMCDWDGNVYCSFDTNGGFDWRDTEWI